MDSINTERSYTEYEVIEPTTDFAIGFDNYSGEDKDAIHVTLDGVNLDNLDYTVVRKNAQVLEVTPAITSGIVRLQRETYIDQAFHNFTAGALFSPKAMDENFEQVRHSQQEVNDGFTFLAENTSGVVAAAEAATVRANAAAAEVETILEGNLNDTQIVTSTGRTQAAKNADRVHVRDFGVLGTGLVDDTAALYNAITSGVALDFRGVICRHTGLSAEVDFVNWLCEGATFIYDGVYAESAINLTSKGSVAIHDLIADTNFKAHVGLRIRAHSTLPSKSFLYLSGVQVKNVRRASTTFLNGDGISIGGGWDLVTLDRPTVQGVYMSVGAEVFGSQGVFGITIASYEGKYAKHIRINQPYVSNVWSEDSTYQNDQDGIRIFQDMADSTSSCIITNYVCHNVANRAVKFHSSPNPILNGMVRVMDSTVIPRSGSFSNPDVDFQQASGIATNLHFYYNGVWHDSLVRNHSERDESTYGGGVVSNLTAELVGTSVISVVGASGSAIQAGASTKFALSISNISIQGSVSNVLAGWVRGTASNYFTMSNVVANIGAEVVNVRGDTTASTVVALSNIINTNTVQKPVIVDTSTKAVVYGSNLINLDSTTVVNNFGLQKNSSGLGIGGVPDTNLDIHGSTGGTTVKLRGSSSLSAASSESNYVGWYEWFHQGLNKRLGFIGFSSGASNDLDIRHEGTTGVVNMRVQSSLKAKWDATLHTIFTAVKVNGLMSATNYENSGGVLWNSGTGTPEGVVTAPKGSLFSRTDGLAAESLYVKTTATGNTGWLKTTLI